MTSSLRNNAVDLAIAAVVSPLTTYGLRRMLPVPSVGFLAVAVTINFCAGLVISRLGSEYADRLAKEYGYSDVDIAKTGLVNYMLFQRLSAILTTISANILLPIFARYVGQRMGIQVPNYPQMWSYYYLTGSAFWIAKSTFEILSDAYYSKPATK